jgi:hypothetical protein
MSNPADLSEELTPAEANIGKALVLIHRLLPQISDPARKAQALKALGKAISLLETARQSLPGEPALSAPSAALGAHNVATTVAPEIAAVIAAAVSVVIELPCRLVSVRQVTVPVVPHLNVWAVEGRTQIFMSHKVR